MNINVVKIIIQNFINQSILYTENALKTISYEWDQPILVQTQKTAHLVTDVCIYTMQGKPVS